MIESKAGGQGAWLVPARGRHLWSIVLAGGEGERTRDFVRARFGVDKPKQYCTFIGRRSLLQHTVDRADHMISPERRVIVAARHHRLELERQMASRPRGTLLFQPRNLGTAPGVFLPLARVLASDPGATVVVLPSDHFVRPERRFLETMSRALAVNRRLDGRPLVIGVVPDRPETEYGWIEAGIRLPSTPCAEVSSVTRFVEKPPHDTAVRILRRGGLWNTSIVIAKAERLWQLGWRHLLEIMPVFATLRALFARKPPGILEGNLELLYSQLPSRDFSRDLLEPAASELAVMKLDACSWSDWGSPGRITESLEAIGRQSPRALALETSPRFQPPATGVLRGQDVSV